MVAIFSRSNNVDLLMLLMMFHHGSNSNLQHFVFCMASAMLLPREDGRKKNERRGGRIKENTYKTGKSLKGIRIFRSESICLNPPLLLVRLYLCVSLKLIAGTGQRLREVAPTPFQN